MHIAYVGASSGGEEVDFDEQKFDFNAMPLDRDTSTGQNVYSYYMWNLGLATYDSIKPAPELHTDSFQRVENFVDPAWVKDFQAAMEKNSDQYVHRAHLYTHVWPGVSEKWLKMFGRVDRCFLKIDAEHNSGYKSKHDSNPCPAKLDKKKCRATEYCEWNKIVGVEHNTAGWNYREAQVDFGREWFRATKGFGEKTGWYRENPRPDLDGAKKNARPGAKGIHVDTALTESLELYKIDFGNYGKEKQPCAPKIIPESDDPYEGRCIPIKAIKSFLTKEPKEEPKEYYGQMINIWFPLSTEDVRAAPLGLVTKDKERMIVDTVTKQTQAVTWHTAKVPHAMLNAVYPRQDGKVEGLTRTSADLRFHMIFSRQPSVEFLQYDKTKLPSELQKKHYSMVAEKKSTNRSVV